MNTTGRYQEQNPDREWVRLFVTDVGAGGPGGSYGLTGGRYVVGGWRTSWVLPATASRSDRVRVALDFVGRNCNTGVAVGYWKDGRGRYWLDVVQATDTLVEALSWALLNGEDAIYDRDGDAVLPTESVKETIANVWGQCD